MCGPCLICACIAACRCAARRWATPPISAARTTAGPTATTAGSPVCRSTGRPTAATRASQKGKPCLPAPNLASYNGLVFINLDPHAQPLQDFLGDFAFYLDFYTKQSVHGLQVRGPQRWRIKANWKIGAENFSGDMYHTPHTHASIVEIGLFREPKAQKRKDGATYWAHRGGGTTYKLPPGDFDERMRYVGYPDEMIDRHQRRLDTSTAAGSRRGRLHVLGRHLLSEPELRAQLAQAARRRTGAAVHLDPAVAADQRERNRGVLVVRGGLGRTGAVQEGLLQGVSDVLRVDRHVRTGRRGELGVADHHRRRLDGTSTAAEQPDGTAVRRQPGRRSAARRVVPRAGACPGRLQRVQPARVAQIVGRAAGGECSA